jgi:hypothetical protein
MGSTDKADVNSDVAGSRHVSRRTLVRAGATAGWVVPVISVATAAPALAVSSPPNLSVTVTNVSKTSTTLSFTVTVTNSGGTTASGVSLIVSFGQNTKPSGGATNSPDWALTSGAGPSKTFTYAKATPLAPGASSSFTVSYTYSAGFPSNQQVTLTPSSTTSGTVSNSTTFKP